MFYVGRLSKTGAGLTMATLALAVSLLAGCAAGAPPQAAAKPAPDKGQVEPQAGSWMTWVLTSPDQVKVPPPPDRDATAKEMADLRKLMASNNAGTQAQIAYWDAGSPSYRWVNIALDELRAKPFTSPRNIRAMSLINVAVYDAMVVAWHWKYTYNRTHPDQVDSSISPLVQYPNSPSYPSEHAVAAGAASAVMAYLWPTDAMTFTQQAQADAQSRVLAGANFPSDVSAGLDLGRAVGALVVARAKADGSDAKWTGTVPTGPGFWVGTNPVEPLAGTWKPWVLKSGDQLRPPPPPAYNSPQKLAELAELHAITRTLDLTTKALYWQQLVEAGVAFWYQVGSQHLFEYHLDGNAPRSARAYAVMSVAQYDTEIACWDAKFTYWAIRPSQLDPTLTTLFPPPNHPSYPAAHGCASGAMAAALAYLFPAPADAAYITAKAEEAAHSRMTAGIHYRSDVENGLALGRAVAKLVADRAGVSGGDAAH
jgi:membrane-associated phospholipid phosphatase